MKVLAVADGHLYQTPDGRIWAERIYSYDFFARYLSAFDEVRVAIRITDIQSSDEYPILCSGPNIEYWPIEEFRGPAQYAKKYFKIRKGLKNCFHGCDCGIFRIPSTVGYQLLHAFQKTGKPYAVEVVVDPWDFAAPGMLGTPLRPVIRHTWTRDLKRACLHANGVSYVTQFALQKRYPSYAKFQGESKEHFESCYSSVNLPDDYYGEAKKYRQIHSPIRIVHVTNSISNYVKGHRELISAAAELKKQGYTVQVEFVGDGKLIHEFEQLAKAMDVGDQVRFIGKLATPDLVRAKLLDSDMFVFPSHAEGLPRVLIEAMAVGLPAISTDVNGIPELLAAEYLVPAGEVNDLAAKIKRFADNDKLYEQASRENIEKAREYSETDLQERRKKFYKKLANLC